MQRLQGPESKAAWERFVEIYTPLFYYWVRQAGWRDADAADLVQDILMTLLQQMPVFSYEPGQSFRNWLWTIMRNKCRHRARQDAVRRGVAVEDIADAGNDPTVQVADREFQAQILQQSLKVMRREFEETTWTACWEHVVRDRAAVEVAAELGITVNAVYIAKSRVLRVLRRELAGLLT